MAKPARILLVSTSYPSDDEDWKGRFIADMANAIDLLPEYKLALWAPPGKRPSNTKDAASMSDKRWLQALLAQGGIASQLRTGGLGGLFKVVGLLRRLRHAYRAEPHDLAHVNWLQNALPLWGTKTPTLVTVLGSDYGLLDKPGMRGMLRLVFRQRRTLLAPNAAWMVPRLESDFGDIAKVVPVPFGVDGRWFAIRRDHVESGNWLAISRLTRNKIGSLFAWGEGLFGGTRHLHLFGPMQEPMDLPTWVTWHGPTYPAELRDDWFPRATGLITLSRHDEGRPQVMLEAMAAGLPVIASDMSAHRDFIQHGETGWLVKDKDRFAEALNALEEISTNQRVGIRAQRWVKESIGDWDDCASRYGSLYQQLLAS